MITVFRKHIASYRLGTLGPHGLQCWNVCIVEHALEILEERIVVLINKAVDIVHNVT